MKLVDIIFEKSLATSVAFKNAVSQVKDLSLQIQELALLITTLARVIQLHELKINELYKHLDKSTKENSIDLSLPNKKTSKAEKPN